MAAGLTIWNANGFETLSITDEVGRILGTFNVAAGSSGSTDLPAVAGYTPFVLTVAQEYGTKPEVKFTGTVLSWYYRPNNTYSTAVAATIYYGVY
jgi:hypothetical protein